MKNEIAELIREKEKLQSRVGKTRPVVARGFDADGQLIGAYEADGEPNQGKEGAVCFDFIEKMLPVFFSSKRYGVIASGRSAGKSHGAARWILLVALTESCRILVARETLISLSESMYSLLSLLIRNDDYLSTCFEILQNKIICMLTGTEILFKGLRRDRVENSIKSIEGIKYCIVEESQTISKVSLQILRPSIRDEDSRIIFLINPRYTDDAVFEEFVVTQADDVESVKITYRDNPWCPGVMLDEAARDYERDPITAGSIWGGDLWKTTDEIVFHNFVSEEFDIDEEIEELRSAVHVGTNGALRDQRERRARQNEKINNAFYIGFDHGWVHPCAGIEVYFDHKNKRIFVINELYQTKLKLTEIGNRLKECIPRTAEGWPVQVDNSRPDVVDHLKDSAINAHSCKKIMIKERIDALQTFLVIVHPRCEKTLMELSSYRWAKDRNDVILPVPVDEHNDLLDALAYSLAGELIYGKTNYEQMEDPFL